MAPVRASVSAAVPVTPESALFLEIPRVRCDGFGGRKCRRRAVVRITTQQRSRHLMFWSGLVCACVKHAIERLKRMEEQA